MSLLLNTVGSYDKIKDQMCALAHNKYISQIIEKKNNTNKIRLIIFSLFKA